MEKFIQFVNTHDQDQLPANSLLLSNREQIPDLTNLNLNHPHYRLRIN